jgi:hypothetical protein
MAYSWDKGEPKLGKRITDNSSSPGGGQKIKAASPSLKEGGGFASPGGHDQVKVKSTGEVGKFAGPGGNQKVKSKG